jgi:uncharacterized membrane protein
MTKTLFPRLVFIAAIGSGITAGVFFAFSSFVIAALKRISPEHGVAVMNSINVTVINPGFMSAFAGTALLCLLLSAGSIFKWDQGVAKLALIASLVYLIGTFGVTIVFNVPLNDKLAKQGISFWQDYLAAWTLWNHIRTVAAAVSASLFSWALYRY